MFQKLTTLWEAWRPKRLSEVLTVEWDAISVRTIVVKPLEPQWNQEFRWDAITRVCLKDEGIYKSDRLILRVLGRENSVFIPTEARNGSAFFGQLCDRGLFPVWRKAMGSTNGSMHCWPPYE